MTALDTLIQILVVIGFGLWAYSKVKRQSIKDTIGEIKEIISGFKNE